MIYKGVPLGIIEGHVTPGEHISIIMHDDNDLLNVTRFWTVADPADAFVFIGPRAAIHTYGERFASEGMQFKRLKKEGRLTILEANTLDITLMHKIASHLVKAAEHGTKLLRVLGALPGWAQKKQSQSALCEHLWNNVIVGLPAVLLCPYRIKVFDASSLLTQALETHPLIISKNRLLRSSPGQLGTLT